MVMVGIPGLLSLAGCGFLPEKVQYNDAEVQELLQAREDAAVHRFGFTSVPASATIRIERVPRGGYDRMLHVQGATRRTIAFRKEGEKYIWIGEQESFQGPKEYTSVDGTSRERIILTYELERLSHQRTNTLIITYWGEDPRLVKQKELTLESVSPILREWGYDLR